MIDAKFSLWGKVSEAGVGAEPDFEASWPGQHRCHQSRGGLL